VNAVNTVNGGGLAHTRARTYARNIMFTVFTLFTRDLKLKDTKGFSGERLAQATFTGRPQAFTGCYARLRQAQ
jgi:hypothetical protein